MKRNILLGMACVFYFGATNVMACIAPILGGEHICIQNEYTGEYLSDAGLHNQCSVGEKWTIALDTLACNFCIQNEYNGLYLSDNGGLYENCSTGERWELDRNPDDTFCIYNVYTGEYLSDAGLYSQCSTGEKWIIDE